ncbi:hypothetical protein JW698_03115 [Candidatus Wolfebacteria bacterium]|nr:hypothetical protein [Candidatus Wolfebacteria bacterium]
METVSKTAKYLRLIARIALLITGIYWFFYGWFTGLDFAEEGIKGLLTHFPNTIPWILLLIFIFIGWKKELVGGIILVLIGFFTIYFFSAMTQAFVMIEMSLPLIIFGACLIISWALRRKSNIPTNINPNI